MKNITVLGGDPGIAPAGTAVIKTKAVSYSLITAETLKTSARDETRNIGQQHINELLQIQAFFDAWGVRLARCNRLSGYLVKGHGDDAFFLTEQTIESVIALRQEKVANAQIKEGLEKAGIDFFVLTRPSDLPVTTQTQLQKVVHEAAENAFQ